jgi:hypothetical protein
MTKSLSSLLSFNRKIITNGLYYICMETPLQNYSLFHSLDICLETFLSRVLISWDVAKTNKQTQLLLELDSLSRLAP